MASVTPGTYTTTPLPRWAGDFSGREHNLANGARVNPVDFLAEGAVRATVGAGGAAGGATSVPVAALSGPIPAGTSLDFGGAKFARLTASAAAGATSLTVAALPTALVAGDTATSSATNSRKLVPAGTLLGRTRAERDAATGFGPWVTGDEEVYLSFEDVTDATRNPDVTLYRRDGLVKENHLPGFATRPAGEIAAIRAAYECVRGTD